MPDSEKFTGALILLVTIIVICGTKCSRQNKYEEAVGSLQSRGCHAVGLEVQVDRGVSRDIEVWECPNHETRQVLRPSTWW